ncbi:MAG: hypothetical protein KA149_04970, partial [Chitinophagales bacterium]|nr:hypothetical protein [Chitinophagales bacterium]
SVGCEYQFFCLLTQKGQIDANWLNLDDYRSTIEKLADLNSQLELNFHTPKQKCSNNRIMPVSVCLSA